MPGALCRNTSPGLHPSCHRCRRHHQLTQEAAAGPAPTQRPPGRPAQPPTPALAQLVPDISCLSRPLCWSERAAELRRWQRGEGGSQGPVAACPAGMGGGGGSWATPPTISLGDPKKVRLCALSTTGLWRRQEIQASMELA